MKPRKRGRICRRCRRPLDTAGTAVCLHVKVSDPLFIEIDRALDASVRR